MKVKVKDIAKEAGVSPATVSLVLNNRPSRIAEETSRHAFYQEYMVFQCYTNDDIQ